MNIILKEDIKGLGFKNDEVKVKNGFGRNYLIPRKLAVIANLSNRKMRDEDMRQASHKQEQLKVTAEELKTALEKLTLKISAKVGDSGKIFGSITVLQVSDLLKEKGYAVDRKRISFSKPVREVGEHIAEVALHREVTAELVVKVVGEE